MDVWVDGLRGWMLGRLDWLAGWWMDGRMHAGVGGWYQVF